MRCLTAGAACLLSVVACTSGPPVASPSRSQVVDRPPEVGLPADHVDPGFRVRIVVDPLQPQTGEPVDFRVDVHNPRGDSARVWSVSYGDGAVVRDSDGRLHCRRAIAHAVTDVTVHLRHTYRAAGRMHVRVAAMSQACHSPSGNIADADLDVGDAGDVSNGPAPPVADINDLGSGFSHVHVTAIADDPDGFVSRVLVLWGYDDRARVFTFDASACHDSPQTWPSTARRIPLSHDFKDTFHEPHAVQVTVTSVGCDGHSKQETSKLLFLPDRRHEGIYDPDDRPVRGLR